MNGLSVSGKKADQNLQIELVIKPEEEIANFLSLSVQHD